MHCADSSFGASRSVTSSYLPLPGRKFLEVIFHEVNCLQFHEVIFACLLLWWPVWIQDLLSPLLLSLAILGQPSKTYGEYVGWVQACLFWLPASISLQRDTRTLAGLTAIGTLLVASPSHFSGQRVSSVQLAWPQ